MADQDTPSPLDTDQTTAGGAHIGDTDTDIAPVEVPDEGAGEDGAEEIPTEVPSEEGDAGDEPEAP